MSTTTKSTPKKKSNLPVLSAGTIPEKSRVVIFVANRRLPRKPYDAKGVVTYGSVAKIEVPWSMRFLGELLGDQKDCAEFGDYLSRVAHNRDRNWDTIKAPTLRLALFLQDAAGAPKSDICSTLTSLAEALKGQPESLEHFKRAYELSMQSECCQAPGVIAGWYGEELAAQGKYKEAHALLFNAIENAVKQGGERAADILEFSALDCYADLCAKLHRESEGIRILKLGQLSSRVFESFCAAWRGWHPKAGAR